MLRIGKIKVNGKKKDQTYKLEEGDEITLWMGDEEIEGLKNQNSKTKIETNDTNIQSIGNQAHQSRSKNPLDIIYEDEYLIVINKPAGINVHAGDHKTQESNIIDQVQDYLRGEYDSITFRPALVHRIDRDTSGCLLIAKQKPVEALLKDLQNHRIEKVYHAIVVGTPPEIQGTIRAKLKRREDAKDEAKVFVDEVGGQTAVTHYTILKDEKRDTSKEQESTHKKPYSDAREAVYPITSLLECRIETGRTHQIRVHLAYIGCPIIGDKAYGDKKSNSYYRRNFDVQRQMLHAYSLEFDHPVHKKRLQIHAPYTGDMHKILLG